MITLLEKKYLQQSRVHRHLASFQEWPLVPFMLSSRVKSSVSSSDAYTIALPVTDDGHVVAVLAVVAAPPTMSTAGKLRLVSKADDVVQPDTTSARSVRVAQRTAAISTHVPYVQQLDILGYKHGNPMMLGMLEFTDVMRPSLCQS